MPSLFVPLATTCVGKVADKSDRSVDKDDQY